jgi:16S rRNA (guanine966-N2)-methyltransferase
LAKALKIPQSSLRVIGGLWRGRRLAFPCVEGLRPTPDRIRETLFNWLQPRILQARCLDVCAGSGALGFEALSRGAQLSRLLEKHPQVAAALRDNAQRLGASHLQVVVQDALSYLQQQPAEPFDLVFLDPPFALALWQPLAEALTAHGWLAPGAWVYVETPKGTAPVLPASWVPLKEKTAGQVSYALYAYHP